MLRSLIDGDDFCKRLMASKDEDIKVNFYSCFYNLLMDPSEELMECFLSNYMIQDIVNGLRHLIKVKFNRLTDEVAKNIVKIVEVLLKYGENSDTLVVNLLRHHLVDEVYLMYRNNTRYFKEHPNCMTFLVFFCSQNSTTREVFGDESFSSRDFLFTRVKDMWDAFHSNSIKRKAVLDASDIFPFEFPEGHLSILLTPTPVNIIFSQLSVELEMNVMFILENDQNFDFHLSILFRDYIRAEREACWVLRFLANIPRPLNITRLVNSILERYPSSFIALIYDLVLWNQAEGFNGNLVEYLRREKNHFTRMLDGLQQDCKLLRLSMKSINHRQEQTMEEVVRNIHGLSFSRYYGMVKEMEKWGTPVVPREMYSRVIPESFRWDGYAQVYLWKILGFQKIYLGFDIDEVTNGSLEAVEGSEIIKNLRTLGG